MHIVKLYNVSFTNLQSSKKKNVRILSLSKFSSIETTKTMVNDKFYDKNERGAEISVVKVRISCTCCPEFRKADIQQ